MESETYNALVESFNEFRYFLEVNHGNNARAMKLANMARKLTRSRSENITLIEINGLLQNVRDMRDLIRDLGRERNWLGSQLNWVAPQNGYQDAKYLHRALSHADDRIVNARTLLDQNGPNQAPKKISVNKLPKPSSTAAPIPRFKTTEAGIALYWQLILLLLVIDACFDEDIEETDVDLDFIASLDMSRPLNRDNLYVTGSILREVVAWTHHQDTLSNLPVCDHLSLRYVLEAAEGALVAAENALPGYVPPARGVSGAAAKLKFKKQRAQRTAAPAGAPPTSQPAPPTTDIGHIQNPGGPDITVPWAHGSGGGAVPLSPLSNPSPPRPPRPSSPDADVEL